MNFDSVVARLEGSLLPLVRNEEHRLRTAGKFTEVQISSLRHAEYVHAMGIACRPVWASEKFERLSLMATLLGFNDVSGRIDVQWSQVFDTRSGAGYVKKEAGGFRGKLNSEAALVRFENEWSRMFRLFLRVADRGRPSPYLIRRLRGAPPDQRGRKANQASADAGVLSSIK